MALGTFADVVQDQFGNAISGAQITVYNVVSNARVTNPLPSIYAASDSDASSPVALNNPLTTDAVGRFAFAAPDGPYDVVVTGGTSYSGYSKRIRLVAAAATGAGSGTVTSVALSLPSQFAVSGSPVTGVGTLTAGWNNQSANVVFAGPSTGAATAPAFRALVNADLPASGATAGTYGSVSGLVVTVPVVTVNAKGITTAISTQNITIPALSTGVPAGTFGGITGTTITVPVITVTSSGLLTNVTTTNITVPATTANNNWALAQRGIVNSPVFGVTVTIDASQANLFSFTATSNFTLANFTNVPPAGYGQTIQLKIKQDATGSRIITYGTNFKFPSATSSVLSTTANAEDILTATYFPDSGFWYCTLLRSFA